MKYVARTSHPYRSFNFFLEHLRVHPYIFLALDLLGFIAQRCRTCLIRNLKHNTTYRSVGEPV